MNRKATKRPTAFSLIEMLAVVMILAIASVIVLPHLGPRDDLRLASASRELTADLLYVQNRAISTGKTHFIVFDSATGSYDVLESIDPPVKLIHPDLHRPFHVDLGHGALAGVTIQSANFDGQPVLAFDALGTPWRYDASSRDLSPMKSGAVVLASGSQTMTVTVTPFTGVLKVK